MTQPSTAPAFAAAAEVAEIVPVIASATSTATKVTGDAAVSAGGSRIARSGSSAPSVNATADESAACHGLTRSS